MGIKMWPSNIIQVLSRSPVIIKVDVVGRFKRSEAFGTLQNSAAVYLKLGGLYYQPYGGGYASIDPATPVDDFMVTTSWADYSLSYPLSPVTGKPWTWAEINTLQIGISLRRPKTIGVQLFTYCTWCAAKVYYVGAETLPGEMRPYAAGDDQGITYQIPNDGGAHYLKVNEVYPDEDTTVVYAEVLPLYYYDTYDLQTTLYQ